MPLARETAEQISFLEPVEHVMLHHYGADGWITLATKHESDFRQRYYRANDVPQALREWMGENIYFSQNTFFVQARRVDTVRQLRSLYVDLDFYKKGLTRDQVLMALRHEHFKQTIPEPNLIMRSGRGLALVWWLEPVPHQALPLWQAVEDYFVKVLAPLGSDPAAKDASRILRVAGSTNSKSGARVQVQLRHEFRYTLRDIQSNYLPALLPTKERKTHPATQTEAQRKVKQLYSVYRLHYERRGDLNRLAELRDWDLRGHREVMCFLNRYWGCCFLQDTNEALEQALAFNEKFKEPLPEREVRRDTKSAERAYKEWLAGRENPGQGRDGYNYRNETLIRLLDISPEEQRHLSTIISQEEKNRRRRKRDLSRAQRREQSLATILQTKTANPTATVRELAKLTGFSVGYVSETLRATPNVKTDGEQGD